jgi:hypothetical protein
MAKKQTINPNLIIALGGLAIAYYGIIKPILEKIGLKQSEEGKLIEKTEKKPNKENPFSPTFLRSLKPGSKVSLLKSEAKKNLAKRIYDAMGYFSDDEAAVISAFRILKTQSQVADLATYFSIAYKTDLLDFLRKGKGVFPQAGLNESELSEILNIVNNLPKQMPK